MNPPERAERSNLFQVACTNMIPAERCVLLIWPSMQEREHVLQYSFTQIVGVPLVVMKPLEAHGIDEIGCKWEGVLQLTEQLVLGTDGGTEYAGECPRCGQQIILR